MLVRAAPREHFDWLIERCSCGLTQWAKAIEAVDDEGRIRGMVAYDCWTLNSVQAHMAVDSPIVWRSLVRPAFEFPFRQAKRNLLVGIIPSHNERSVQMTRALGFREAYRLRDGWDIGDDLVVFEMRPHECRWLEA